MKNIADFRRRPLAVAILAALATPAITLAQTAPAPAAPSSTQQTLPEVKVEGQEEKGFRTDSTRGATRTDTPLRDIPQFINTVPQAVMRSQNSTTLQEALRNVPGIS